jgi:hypothetical protein
VDRQHPRADLELRSDPKAIGSPALRMMSSDSSPALRTVSILACDSRLSPSAAPSSANPS